MFEAMAEESPLLYICKNSLRQHGSFYIPRMVHYLLLAQPYLRRILGRAAPMNYSQGG